LLNNFFESPKKIVNKKPNKTQMEKKFQKQWQLSKHIL